MNRHGVTLLELLLASTIGFVILLALGHVDVTRIRMSQDISQRSQILGEASLALVSITRDLELADQVLIFSDAACTTPAVSNGRCIQIRIPEVDTNGPASGPNACPAAPQTWTCRQQAGLDTPIPPVQVPDPCCFNTAGNYRWVQYRLRVPNTIQHYADAGPPCGQLDTFSDVSLVKVRYMDESQAPNGGTLGTEPLVGGPDNNIVEFSVIWGDRTDNVRTMTSEVALRGTAYTNANGLDVSNASPPPAPCP